MGSERLLALSDGVIAVIITIMVLELKPPAGHDLAALAGLWPVMLGYVLSFLYVAIYWNNHHHFFQLAPKVNGAILWANFGLLFWLSLLPFATTWFGEHAFAAVPTAVYGVVLFVSAVAFFILQRTIIAAQGPGSPVAAAIGRDLKGKLSPVLYLVGIGLAFVAPPLSDAVYAGVALMWLVPDRRVAARVGSAARSRGV